MENHFHLVAMTPERNFSRWMHQLKTAYTVYFNRRHQVVGHLFQGRFKSTVIETEKYLLEVSRYLHLNPVRGMVLGQGTPSERRERLREYREAHDAQTLKVLKNQISQQANFFPTAGQFGERTETSMGMIAGPRHAEAPE